MRAYATRKLFRISQTSLHVLLYVYVVTTLRNVLCIHATTVKNCNHMKSLFSGILRIKLNSTSKSMPKCTRQFSRESLLFVLFLIQVIELRCNAKSCRSFKNTNKKMLLFLQITKEVFYFMLTIFEYSFLVSHHILPN